MPIRALAWVLLDGEQAGVSVTSLPATDATRAIGEVRCVGVEVPAIRQLGDVTSLVQVAHAVLTGEEWVGSMAWCVQTAATYACEREQFGRPIGQFQAVKHRCADMAVRLERSRALVWDAARAFVADRPNTESRLERHRGGSGGYLVPHWPAPWRRNAGPIAQLLIDEEFDAVRLRRPHLQVAAWVLPMIVNHGTRSEVGGRRTRANSAGSCARSAGGVGGRARWRSAPMGERVLGKPDPVNRRRHQRHSTKHRGGTVARPPQGPVFRSEE